MFLINCRPLLMTSMTLIRNFSLSAVNNKTKNHYDSLGLTPKATQADIKSAYYKLSMQYHPDKNKGSEGAAEMFRDITAAYEVLGNLKLRKLYDKGILHTAGPQFAQQQRQEESMEMEDDSQNKFYQSRVMKNRGSSGKSNIYDFDEWTKAHYGKSFSRREAAKKRYEMKMDRVVLDGHMFSSEILFFALTAVFTVIGLFYFKKLSYDIVDETIENKNSKVSNSVSREI